ncbi:MAG: PEP/pyruvate-binding domain-containing protein [Gemmataceae bacterium]
MSDLRTFDEIGPDDADAVGGKGLSLGRMATAGLPVPPGFCLTTAALRRLRGGPLMRDPELVSRLNAACAALGDGQVAVRSSATGEDGAVFSFAGQQDTILGVVGADAVRAAVEACWASLDGERAVAYRRQQGVRDDDLAMAVVVQRLVPAEVAGVLFTRDPLDPSGRQMLVEASWGLGETVVSGRVTPDRYHLDRATGKVIDRHIAEKKIMRTAKGEEAVPLDRQTLRCLDDAQLVALAELGRQVEAFYGQPRAVEWAYAGGQFWLLQARPITTGGMAEREAIRREEVARLRALAAPCGTVWSRFNLAEVLPTPTPMTWAIVSRHLMSGRGGFGQMYRDLGYEPDPVIDEHGIFDLVCGRPYCNLSREPRLHYRQMPFEHSFAALKADPRRALYPTPGINAARFAWHFWLFLPVTLPLLSFKLLRSAVRRQRLIRSFATRFRTEIVPAFVRETQAAARVDLTAMDEAAVVRFRRLDAANAGDVRTRDLKPTALAALCMAGWSRSWQRCSGGAGRG